jgi:hypothetical protein
MGIPYPQYPYNPNIDGFDTNEPGVQPSPGNPGVVQVHGVASAMQNLTADLQYYICFASSPLCFSDPNPNPPPNQETTRLVNIQVTQNPFDISQKNFEVLLMSIGLRAMPVVLQDPVAVPELREFTRELSGEGFVWKFAVERGVQFYNFTPFGIPGPVGLLINDLDGVILPSGVRITTVAGSPSGWAQNVTFNRIDYL